jgi:hypothetical protein
MTEFISMISGAADLSVFSDHSGREVSYWPVKDIVDGKDGSVWIIAYTQVFSGIGLNSGGLPYTVLRIKSPLRIIGP